MTYDLFREANTMLAGIAFFWLGYRTVRAWPAEWAKPNHVRHYRVVLVLLAGTYAAISLGSVQHEVDSTQAGPISPVVTALTLAVLVLCWRWPRPKPFAREET